MRVIIFDVDNTLVKGNLTFFFLKFLVLERIYFFYKCIPLLVSAVILVFRTLPRITRKTDNLRKLDRSIGRAIADFYKKLFTTFKKLRLTGPQLEKKAKKFFSEDFFKKHLYVEGLKKNRTSYQKQKKHCCVTFWKPTGITKHFVWKNLCTLGDQKYFLRRKVFCPWHHTKTTMCRIKKNIRTQKAVTKTWIS
jgi:hypothetical protein